MKIDLHVHCSEVSRCAHVPAAEMVNLYKKAGYDAIVLTNHFTRHDARSFAEEGVPDYVKLYTDTVRLAQREGTEVGLRVFFGMEMHFDQNCNDYLVYGIPEELLKECDSLWAMGAVRFGELARERGFLFYQAHPFRNNMTVMPPSAFFGIEVKNAHPRHDSRNDIAAAWAKKFHLHGIGGSDAHQVEDVGTSGIETPRDVRSIEDLVAVLRDDDYTIL